MGATMGTTMSAIKTLIVPAVVSLILFLLLTYVLLPIWRRYRARYSQYLPLDSISSSTSSIRHRIIARLAAWRSSREGTTFASGSSSDVDGEELEHVDEDTWRVIGRVERTDQPDDTRRLSRDLEEGFRDDSDEESDQPSIIVRS